MLALSLRDIRSFLVAASVTMASGFGCDSSSPGAVAGGAPVTGAADMHCSGVPPIAVSTASCGSARVAPPPDGGAPADAGESSEDAGEEEMAAVLFNAEGDDDDCKYHVKFTTTPAAAPGGSLTFILTMTKKSDGTPATGAIDGSGDGVSIEAYLDSNNFHVAPNTTPAMTATETPPGSGVYTITPVKLDARGRWVVRFHYYETCSDALPDSPHGHVAFYFNVP